MNEIYDIVSYGSNRFVIINKDGEVVDDAQGYGYKTRQNAHKALAWKFKGGKEKSDEGKIKCNEWKKENPDLFKKINKLYGKYLESYFQEIAQKETTEKEIWEMMEKELSAEIPIFVRYVIKNYEK